MLQINNHDFFVSLQATYSKEACSNVISEVGFGPGPLRRVHHSNVREGTSYLILGNDFSKGIPGMPSMTIDFFDPGSQLTFHWFKHHIMCQDHPSICGQQSPRRKTRTKQMKKQFKDSGGKKTRRRKKDAISKQNEFNRQN